MLTIPIQIVDDIQSYLIVWKQMSGAFSDVVSILYIFE
jgi:hypothetical protein